MKGADAAGEFACSVRDIPAVSMFTFFLLSGGYLSEKMFD